MSQVADNLKKLMEREDGMNPSRLARETGVSQPTIWKILNEKIADPGSDILEPIAKRFGKAVAQLRGEIPIELEDVVDAHDTKARLPLISWVQAGLGGEAADPYAPGSAESWMPFESKYSGQAFCLRVRGDSMVTPDGGGFPEDTIIAVEPKLAAQHGDYVVVRFTHSNEATFKQLVIDGPFKFLKPLNPRYNTFPVPADAVLCGVVTESTLKRKLR